MKLSIYLPKSLFFKEKLILKVKKSEAITKNCSNQIKKNLEYWDSQKTLEEVNFFFFL